ncbi:MAG TPA: hypothetical protein GX010_02640 [Erysipelotrichaceae bacterium]|nr:hypothetical protein [Erysipelotrichaceae bacterium]
MFEYYIDYLNQNDRITNYAFEEFEKNYYSNFFSESITNYICSISRGEKNQSQSNSELHTGSADGKFQLGCSRENPTSGSRFQNGVPFYNTNFYDRLQKGDIFLENDLSHCYHVGIVTDLDYPVTQFSSQNTYIQVIEAIDNSSGVQFGYLDDQRIIENKFEIYRYYQGITDYQFNLIYAFLDEQIGDDYKLHNHVQTSYYCNDWYCGELVYAAYYYAGINIAPSFTDLNSSFLIGTTICNGITAERIHLDKDLFLILQMVRKNFSSYTIRIINCSNFYISAYYNSKMCFENDAKNWVNLNDIHCTDIFSYSYVEVSISMNWFATHVTTSFCLINLNRKERLITYANELSDTGLTSYNNVKFE